MVFADLMGEFIELLLHRPQLGKDVETRIVDGHAFRCGRVLGKVGRRDAAGALHIPRGGFQRAGDDPQERGLAFAIGADEPDARTAIDLEYNPV